jgi:hypothetical protein
MAPERFFWSQNAFVCFATISDLLIAFRNFCDKALAVIEPCEFIFVRPSTPTQLFLGGKHV